jgi:disease resistance protein RPM1
MNWDGTLEACCVHDTFLDLITSLSTEESFITVVLGDGKRFLGRKQEVRRLSLHSYIAWPAMNMQKMRSLTIFKPAVSTFKPADVVVGGSMPSLSSYHLLRVLDLRDYKVKDLASMGFVGSLSHLRYLGLSTSARKERRLGADPLPVELGKLQFLQTLDVSETKVEVPSSIIAGIRQLMCLRGRGVYFPESTSLSFGGLKNLTSLKVLESAVVTSEHIAKELGYLTRLRVLEVSVRIPHLMGKIYGGHDEWSACTNALVESLVKLKEIESLHIRYNNFIPLCFNGSMEEPLGNLRKLRIDRAQMVPTWIGSSSLPSLTHLYILAIHERTAYIIQVLGKLPCLRHLNLIVTRVRKEKLMGGRCVVERDAFPCLVRCEFRVPGGMAPSMFPRGAMPKLQDFTFNIELKQFWGGTGSATVDDMALDHLPSLRSVTVSSLHYFGGDEARKDKVEGVRRRLEHEAAVHPNRPLRIRYGGSA